MLFNYKFQETPIPDKKFGTKQKPSKIQQGKNCSIPTFAIPVIEWYSQTLIS